MVKITKNNIKNIILLALFIISSILFLFNAKFILEADTNYTTDAYISYITPLSAYFDKGGKFFFTIDKNNSESEVLLNAKLIKKIKLNINSEHKDIVITINKAGIKLPYLPAIYFPLQSPYRITYENLSVVFTDISVILVIVPLLLLSISIICFIMLFLKYIKRILFSIKDYNRMFIGIVIFIILFEIVKFSGMHSNLLGNDFNMFLYIFKSDSYFLSIFILLLYSAIQVKSKYVSAFILLLFCSMVFVLILDIAIITLLSARLRFADASGLMPDIASVIKMAKGFFITSVGIYSLILIVYIICFSIYIVYRKDLYQFSKPYKIILFTMVIIFAPLFIFKLDIKSYYGTALQDSIIVANMKKTEDVLYSQSKINSVLGSFKFNYSCIDGYNSRKNIIILVIESLSSNNSKFFSGIEDKTSNIDNIAINNIYSLNYYCNSYNAYQNIFVLLTGNPLITRAKNYKISYNTFYENSIVKDFQNSGYEVEYYSAADTVFDGIGKMVKSTGISSLYDANSAIFDDIKKRFVFKGVEDKDFYNIVLNKLREKHSEKPYLVFLTTMSTHGPYEDPSTGDFSHIDLGKSLEYLTLDKACFNQFQKNIFQDNNSINCVIYQQLINLALIDVKCGNSYMQVLLDGDNTRFVSDNLNITDKEKDDLINYINYLRLIN